MDDERLVAAFLDAVWLESGLSDNTLAAYKSDLAKFIKWLHKRDKNLLTADDKLLQNYLSARVDNDSRRSAARSLSALKRFYRYALTGELIAADPCAEIVAPAVGKSLPKTISEEQVTRLINAPNTAGELGLRDRAMLETLYATGFPRE